MDNDKLTYSNLLNVSVTLNATKQAIMDNRMYGILPVKASRVEYLPREMLKLCTRSFETATRLLNDRVVGPSTPTWMRVSYHVLRLLHYNCFAHSEECV